MSLTIRPRDPDDDHHITDIYSRINHDRPPQTVEDLRHRLSAIPERANDTWLIAERDGQVVGYADFLKSVYTDRPGAYWMQVWTAPGWDRQGIGGALYAHVEDAIRAAGGRTIETRAREDSLDALSFLERRGYRRTGHGDRLSRLDVANARLERSRAAAERVTAAGIRIATLAELGAGEALLHELWELDNATSRDIPGLIDFTQMPYDEWYRYTLEAPGSHAEIFWVALDGDRIVGMCQLELRSPGYVDNAYTAVARDCRGRGIARALKLRAIEWAQQNGIKWMFTGNDLENKAMLAINIDLGYQMLPAAIEMRKDLTSTESQWQSPALP
ncbi:MAG TPA: GNAT family N-acetyltransferase [Chloroflexota bacterium]|nr:GNAT family N-acetyltransferase [Chloroflexota bacterium]